ncbi:MAG: putative Ig domain-containing protein [Bacteroidaceae bacterium]|nr:putative Ig domain-containing protein [Bacteroidaceae bacterium]
MKRSLWATAILLALNCPYVTWAQSPAEKPDYSAYILTPPAPETPRINSAKVFGVRPGAPFLYTIAATGVRPITFSAKGLPAGLKVNPETGKITGKVKKQGTYHVTLQAQNAKGTATRELRIEVGDLIALTPPMGWNSWNCWGNSVSQDKVMASAKAMVEKGLINYGWTYINIDDGWQSIRGGKYNAMQPNRKFPDMKKLADDIHAMGLKLGIYSGPWVGTYAGHIGSMSDNADGTYDWIKEGRHNENYKYVSPEDPEGKQIRKEHYYHGMYSFAPQDAQQWADWGIDYLKYDWNPNDYYYATEMYDAIKKQNRDIVYSLSNSAPYADAPIWMEKSNCYRTTGDIRDNWNSIFNIGFQRQDHWASFNRPGHWADADMLVVGMVGWGPHLHYTKLTPDEQYSHISLWALLASPLLIGCDMSQLDDFTISLLCNSEVNDINQDPLGIQAYRYYHDKTYSTYVKQLEDGSMAIGMFNLSDQPKNIGIIPASLGFRGRQTIRDVWRQKDIATIEPKERWETEVAPHGVALIKVYPGNTRRRVIEIARGVERK